jgi:RNA polymerase sigma-70 factor (ECF subfamily)
VSIDTNNGDLLRRLSSGDKRAYESIYHTYYSRLHRFANEYLNDRENSNDVVQNTFAKLWENRVLLKDNTNIPAWLFTVTRNETLSLLEHRIIADKYEKREQTRLLDANFRALNDLQFSETACTEIIQILRETIKKLPAQCRVVFECSRIRMMSNQEIANHLSISVKTVESHMTRALKTIRFALADYL